MILLGIVGTPSAGKSTVARFLADLGAEWINADLIARDCLHQTAVRDRLVEHFSDAILNAQGEVDRSAVAERVFGDTIEKRAALEFLESVIHPIVRQKITDRLIDAASKRTKVALLDVPLLFESGWDRCCDAIWCVDAPPQIRLARTAKRGWDSEELSRRESNQLSISTKKRLSNQIMRNDSTLESLHEKLRTAWHQLDTIEGGGNTRRYSSSPSHCLTDISSP